MLWFSLWYVYRYQPISHSVLRFSLWDVYRYQPISHSVLWFFTRKLISISAHITLCVVVFTMIRISVLAHITLCVVFFHYETYIGISLLYITLCAVVFTMRNLSASAHITLCFRRMTIGGCSVFYNPLKSKLFAYILRDFLYVLSAYWCGSLKNGLELLYSIWSQYNISLPFISRHLCEWRVL